jgi:hypothetical protein
MRSNLSGHDDQALNVADVILLYLEKEMKMLNRISECTEKS